MESTTDCWNFDEGYLEKIYSEKDQRYYYVHDSMLRMCNGKKGKIEYGDYYNPGRPLSILNDKSKKDPNNFCSNLNEFEVSSRFLDAQDAKILTEYRLAVQRVKGEAESFSFLESAALKALWPYILILGFSLKLGKWASSIRKRRTVPPPQTPPAPPSPTT